MKITKISARKLFGVFDHDIPFNDSGITIVIGENGLGKTVILEATNAFFTENFLFFRDLEFHQLFFYFEGDESWEVTKAQSREKLTISVTRHFANKKTKTKQEKLAEINFEGQSAEEHREYIRHRQMMIMNAARIDQRSLDYYRARDVFLPADLYDEDYQMQHLHRRNSRPDWYVAARKKISIRLIETQRIITAKERGGEAYINRVTKSASELAETIAEIDKTASQVATELDATYPNRLVAKLQRRTIDPVEELNDALSKLDAQRKQLSSMGLLEGSQDAYISRIEEDQKDLVSALKLYVDDSHKKLAPYDQISSKVELFKNIINKRFKHKTLEVDKRTGFVFRSTTKRDERGNFQEIPTMKLSSGEQNELILFYELIFKSAQGDMIFIDEPEVSLHISWQNKFIDDLKEITSINRVSIVIATHSPDIINENWDLKVELKGVE